MKDRDPYCFVNIGLNLKDTIYSIKKEIERIQEEMKGLQLKEKNLVDILDILNGTIGIQNKRKK